MTNKNISLETIKSLRDETGLSLAEIKKALFEADGDIAKAKELLKSLGVTMAEKKSSREVKEGVIGSYIHATMKIGAMIEVLCETDFVARNSEFQELAHDLSMHVVAMKPSNKEELLDQPYVKDPSINVRDYLNRFVAKLGENIQIGRFEVFEI